jgi:AICAR transformylase/IMP cyclohydrolase PurH
MRQNAMFSLADKVGMIRVVEALRGTGDWDFYGSRGTADEIRTKAGVDATDIATLVGEPFPDNLVVTLSQLHFGLLCDRNNSLHMEALHTAGLPYIDLLWVSPYDLEGTIDRGGDEVTVRKATDMGGPALLRSAAKGRRLVASTIHDMWTIIEWLNGDRKDEEQFRRWLAMRAEERVRDYCARDAQFLRGLNGDYEPFQT